MLLFLYLRSSFFRFLSFPKVIFGFLFQRLINLKLSLNSLNLRLLAFLSFDLKLRLNRRILFINSSINDHLLQVGIKSLFRRLRFVMLLLNKTWRLRQIVWRFSWDLLLLIQFIFLPLLPRNHYFHFLS